jgi:hypothetical protein
VLAKQIMSAFEELSQDCRWFNRRYVGRPIFIIGAGPQLSSISPTTFRRLEAEVTIGVNWTTYKLSPTFFLSAYIHHVMIAQLTAPESILLHMRPAYKPPLIPGIIPLKRKRFEPGLDTLSQEFVPPEPTLSTRNNVALAATHFAHILGAGCIIYVGVEQRNKVHFFHSEPDTTNRIRAGIDRVYSTPMTDPEHPYATHSKLVRLLGTSANELEQAPFYKQDHVGTFKAYFDILRARGCRIISTVESSVTVDAGAEYQPLEAVLDQSAATEVIESMRRERECLVATANQNLEAYRAEARKREEALEAYRTAARERDEALAVAAENLEAYQTIDRQYHQLTRRLRWFPLSLLIPRA